MEGEEVVGRKEECVKGKTFFLFLIVTFSFFSSGISQADELSELKTQMKEMQKQVEEMRNRIVELEAEREARIVTPKEVEERVMALEKKVAQKNSLQAYWKDGLRLTTEDKRFDLKIGGKVHLDAAWMKEQSPVKARFGNMKDYAEFRRVRIETAGTIYDNFIYKVELDFADGNVNLEDAYMGLKDIPYFGELIIGHMKEPFGLEELESSNYTTFMERGLPVAFAPDRNIGIALNSHLLDKRLTWAVGIFRDTDNFGDVASNEWNVTARLTGLPWYEDNGERLLHLGAAYSLRNPRETLQYRNRPEAHLAPYFVDTGSFAAKNADLLGLEGAFMYGPFSLQGEFMNAFADRSGNSKYAYFSGLYTYASYILTGEHRNYDMVFGKFSNIVPYKNFSIAEWTFGAWEIAARYSYLDLKCPGIDGGILSDVTLGLNWYLNPNMRIMGNYVHANRNGTGYADILETRFQVNF